MSGAVGQVCPDCGEKIKKGEMVVFRGGQWRHESHPEKKPTIKELMTGKVLNGYLEAARVKTLNEFREKKEGSSSMHTYHFLFDEGLPTEEKIKVEAETEPEAAIKARDEFFKRRNVYHKTARITRRNPEGIALATEESVIRDLERRRAAGYPRSTFESLKSPSLRVMYDPRSLRGALNSLIQKGKVASGEEDGVEWFALPTIIEREILVRPEFPVSVQLPEQFKTPQETEGSSTNLESTGELVDFPGAEVFTCPVCEEKIMPPTYERILGHYESKHPEEKRDIATLKRLVTTQRKREFRKFAVKDIGDVEGWLRLMLDDETKAVNAYKIYADLIRGLGLGAIAEKFEGIASDEARHANIVNEALEAVVVKRKQLEGLR